MDTLTALYLINSILLIVHEIDSAYQEEWKLFRIPGGVSVFLLLHIPLVGLIMYGLIEVYAGTGLGSIISTVVSLGGLFAFSIHTYFIRKGNPEFQSKISQALLYSILVVSIAQLYFTLMG